MADIGKLNRRTALGHRWSCNGDGLGFINNQQNCSKIGSAGTVDQPSEDIGPAVQASLHISIVGGWKNEC